MESHHNYQIQKALEILHHPDSHRCRRHLCHRPHPRQRQNGRYQLDGSNRLYSLRYAKGRLCKEKAQALLIERKRSFVLGTPYGEL